MAVQDSRCGRFAIQLDSDDLYSGPDTLQKIVNAFYEQKAAMVIGSYRMCDFELNTLPPGIIDHKEWTEENGPNNALRINGLGAPRAFFTPLVRQHSFPNTSYGEDCDSHAINASDVSTMNCISAAVGEETATPRSPSTASMPTTSIKTSCAP